MFVFIDLLYFRIAGPSVCSETEISSSSTPSFDFQSDYLHVDCLLSVVDFKRINSSPGIEALDPTPIIPHPEPSSFVSGPVHAKQYVLLHFEQPMLAPPNAIMIASKLDTDISMDMANTIRLISWYTHTSACFIRALHDLLVTDSCGSACRLAFSGHIVATIDPTQPEQLRRLRVYKHKQREGIIDRVCKRAKHGLCGWSTWGINVSITMHLTQFVYFSIYIHRWLTKGL